MKKKKIKKNHSGNKSSIPISKQYKRKLLKGKAPKNPNAHSDTLSSLTLLLNTNFRYHVFHVIAHKDNSFFNTKAL